MVTCYAAFFLTTDFINTASLCLLIISHTQLVKVQRCHDLLVRLSAIHADMNQGWGKIGEEKKIWQPFIDVEQVILLSYHAAGLQDTYFWCQLKTLYFCLSWSQFTFQWLWVGAAGNVKRNYISHSYDGVFTLRHSCTFSFCELRVPKKAQFFKWKESGKRVDPSKSTGWHQTSLIREINVL